MELFKELGEQVEVFPPVEDGVVAKAEAAKVAAAEEE